MIKDTFLKANGSFIPVQIEFTSDKLIFKGGFKCKDEIKSLQGARWNPDAKVWTATNNERNKFRLNYLSFGSDAPLGPWPYARYDLELKPHESKRPLMEHQRNKLIPHMTTREQCVCAAEPGTGKSLAAIEAMEYAQEKYGHTDFFWVAPKNALVSAEEQFARWKCKVKPKLYSYAKFRDLILNWPKGMKSPEFVVFDEASKLKTPTAKQTQAALHLTNAMRLEHERPFIIEMTGTPAPKAPTDWYSISEIACPGFIREGDIYKFQWDLGLWKDIDDSSGAKFKKRITWLDDELKCGICGRYEQEIIDGRTILTHTISSSHPFVRSVNQVYRLYERLQGLVQVVFKKDCIDLPKKIYRKIYCKPNRDVLLMSEIISKRERTAIKRLTLLRELSDGFQYKETPTGKQISCPNCKGAGIINEPKVLSEEGIDQTTQVELVETLCYTCKGNKEVPEVARSSERIDCPKDEVLTDLLDEHEEYGRIVIYAGFSESIDRIVDLVRRNKWDFIRVDGRGWASSIPGDSTSLYALFQSTDDRNIAFIAHPQSGGYALTLTQSPTIVYYSNDFNGEGRMQSEDRIHRPGCTGTNIYDIINLPSDEYVLDNLMKKKDLQSLSLGEFEREFHTR